MVRKDSVEFYTPFWTRLRKARNCKHGHCRRDKGGYEALYVQRNNGAAEAFKKIKEPFMSNGIVDLPGVFLRIYKIIEPMFIVACGSSYHVAVIAKIQYEKLSRIPVEVMLASEFRYCNPIVDPNTLVVLISQSGETADTLEH